MRILIVFYLFYLGLVRCYLANSKVKEALHAAREAMKAMPQSAKALKLVGDVHASNSSGREKVHHCEAVTFFLHRFYTLFELSFSAEKGYC